MWGGGTDIDFCSATSSPKAAIICADASFDHVIALPNSITIA